MRVYRTWRLVALMALGCGSSGEGQDSVAGAAVTCPTTYEAQAMIHSNGVSVEGGWNLQANGYAATNHAFDAGTQTVTVSAAGQVAQGVWPRMVVRVAGTVIGQADVNTTTWKNYPFTFSPTAGTKEIRVEFTNDVYTGTEDRNLLIDKVVVGCVASAGGTGLSGQYFNNIDFTGTAQTRTDASVNFDWGTGAPVSGFGVDTFSVRWTGDVLPESSGTYRFYTTSDDGIRLWVGNQQIVNNWTDHGTTENSGTISLTGGQRYPVRLDYYENGGGAVAKLSWSSSSVQKQIIPQSRLFPSSGSGGSGGSAGSGGSGGTAGSGGTSGSGGSGWGGTPNVTIDRATQYQTIEGFGFFGAMNSWWGSSSSMWSDAWGTQVINDLGMTMWRNEYYSEESNQDANWAKQLPVVQGLKRIADTNRVPLKFIYTVWSAPSSMKCTVASVQAGQRPCTRHPDGLKNGGTLDPSKYSAYAQWLIDGINKYAAAGVNLYALSPQNEPMFVQSYNSTVYDIDPAKLNAYSRMIDAVAPIVKQAHPNVKIFGTENMLELEGQQWFYSPKFSSTTWSRFDALAYHGYVDGVLPSSTSQLATYWNFVRTNWSEPRGKSSWMTETSGYVDAWTGDGEFPGARDLGLAIYAALAHGRVSGWVWWQGSEATSSPGPYTLMGGTTRRSRYYVSKNFYRFIRPGARMVRVTSSDPNLFVVAFVHPTMSSFTVVAINTATTSKSLVLGGSNVPTTFAAHRTSATENCVSLGNVSAPSITLRADSITTLVSGNVFE